MRHSERTMWESNKMNTETRSLYKIWRTPKGRSCKRWLTDEQVAHYRATRPHWRWQKIREQESTERSSYKGSWGRATGELLDPARRTRNPVISWDDILDVQLALKKGNLK